MDTRIFTFCFSLLLLSGCATYDYEGAAHFRELRNNTPVFVTVTDDLDRTSRRVRLARKHLGADKFDSIVDADSLTEIVRQLLRDYGIAVADSETEAQQYVAISIDEAEPTGLGGAAYFAATVTYSAGDTVRSMTVNSVQGPGELSSIQSAFRQLARNAVDSALLLWHPSEPALDVESPWGSFIASNHTLLPTSPIGGQNAVPFDGPLALTWESFPSKRMLTGSGISPEQISNVSYELYVAPMPYNSGGMYELREFEGPIVLKDASFDLGDTIPWCGRVTWTVRARFMLDDHPRVTDWTALSSTWVGAPHGIECYSVGLGVKSQLTAAAATTDYKPFQLEPLGAGDGVLSIMLSPSRCEIDDKACSEQSRNNDNVVLHNVLQNHIGDLTPGLFVQNGAELIDPGWFGDDRKWYEMTADDLSRWLADESNRAALLDARIRRILALHIGQWKMGSSAYDSDSELTMFADVFDVEDGQRLVRLQVERQGPLRDQSGSVLFFILEGGDETELRGTASAFTKSVWRAAEIGVLAAVGAKIGWPESLIDSAKD